MGVDWDASPGKPVFPASGIIEVGLEKVANIVRFVGVASGKIELAGNCEHAVRKKHTHKYPIFQLIFIIFYLK
jgi:hypothetical protein